MSPKTFKVLYAIPSKGATVLNRVEQIGPLDITHSEITELDLAGIGSFPVLDACHTLWLQCQKNGTIPASMNTDELPEEVLQYTMLLDYLPDQRDLEVRVVGTYIGERAVFAAQGQSLRGFFQKRDADLVYAAMDRVAQTRAPSLAQRNYVQIADSRLSYVRLILPLSADGERVTGFFKTIEPASLAEGPM